MKTTCHQIVRVDRSWCTERRRRSARNKRRRRSARNKRRGQVYRFVARSLQVEQGQIVWMAQEVSEARPQSLITFCTLLRAAQLAPMLEAELGIPVYAPVSGAAWKPLRLCGVDTARVKGWGSLFNQEIA